MANSVEMATESIEHATHAEHGDGFGRRVALLIACLAAALALSELGEKGAQNGYLTHHIQARLLHPQCQFYWSINCQWR